MLCSAVLSCAALSWASRCASTPRRAQLRGRGVLCCAVLGGEVCSAGCPSAPRCGGWSGLLLLLRGAARWALARTPAQAHHTRSHPLNLPPCSLPRKQETQTKAEGQIHFFPILFDGRQLYALMAERCGPPKA